MTLHKLNIHHRAMRLVAAIIVALTAMTACIDDSVTTNPAHQPEMSTDTLDMGMAFTLDPTPTHSFTIRNRNSKGIIISHIALREPDATKAFRLNVDGMAGSSFEGVEIRGGDSIYVFAEATLPANEVDRQVRHLAHLDITVNGVTSTVVLKLESIDAVRLRGHMVESGTLTLGERPIPYQVYDSLVVAPGATLTLKAGTQLRFHDSAYMRVYGTLVSEGTAEAPVLMDGDRFGQVVGRIPYLIMPGQWQGLHFTPESSNNQLSHTIVRNTEWGVILTGNEPEDNPAATRTSDPTLHILNCRLSNSTSTVLTAAGASVTAIGCEFSEGSQGLVALGSGNYTLNHCTLANNYLFTAITGPALYIADDAEVNAVIDNSIIYGLGGDMYPGDLTGRNIFVRHCLMSSSGEDDDNFQSIIWGEDPLYYTVRADYHFDYRLQPESPAIGAANPALTPAEAAYDFYGSPRSERPDLGAYVYSAGPTSE